MKNTIAIDVTIIKKFPLHGRVLLWPPHEDSEVPPKPVHLDQQYLHPETSRTFTNYAEILRSLFK